MATDVSDVRARLVAVRRSLSGMRHWRAEGLQPAAQAQQPGDVVLKLFGPRRVPGVRQRRSRLSQGSAGGGSACRPALSRVFSRVLRRIELLGAGPVDEARRRYAPKNGCWSPGLTATECLALRAHGTPVRGMVADSMTTLRGRRCRGVAAPTRSEQNRIFTCACDCRVAVATILAGAPYSGLSADHV